MLVGLPEITTIAGTKALSQVDLIAIPGTNVVLYGGFGKASVLGYRNKIAQLVEIHETGLRYP